MLRAIVDQARQGDEEAFAALVREVGDRCIFIAHRILRDANLAEDAVQVALVQVWRELPALRDLDRFEAWLHRILVNAWTPFKGRIESIGIGPVGIVAQVHSHLDWDAWVASKLGKDWVSRYKEVSFKDGILEITMKRGRGLKVVWADRGFELGDFQDAGFGWYSPDGVEWTAIPAPAWSSDQDSGLGFPTGFGDVVGVSDGFIARGVDTGCSSDDGCAGMWHSSDGLTWRNIGNVVNGSDGQLLTWMGGALVTDGIKRFDFWTSEGHSEWPMVAKLPAAPKYPNATVATGPLGLVSVLKDDQRILVTRDGVDWDIQPMPAEMAAAGGRLTPTVAVGERSVLILLWSGSYEKGYVPSLWLGTLEP